MYIIILSLTHSESLPFADDPVVEGVHDVEHVTLLERHLTLVRLLIVKVAFDIEGVPSLQQQNKVLVKYALQKRFLLRPP